MERVVVQQQHRDATLLGRPEKRRQLQRVAVQQVEVRVAVADVELQRHPGLDRRPGEPAVTPGRRRGTLRPRLVRCSASAVATSVVGRLRRGQRRGRRGMPRCSWRRPQATAPVPAERRRSRPRLGSASRCSASCSSRMISCASAPAGQLGELVGSDAVGAEAGVDEERVTPGAASMRRLTSSWPSSLRRGDSRRRRRTAAGRARVRSTAGAPARASSRRTIVPDGAGPEPSLISASSSTRSSAQHQAVAVVVDQRLRTARRCRITITSMSRVIPERMSQPMVLSGVTPYDASVVAAAPVCPSIPGQAPSS